jgi:hypothetical protein
MLRRAGRRAAGAAARARSALSRVWLHGSDAVAEILASGEVLGGSAALKNVGTEAHAHLGEDAADQEMHFFMVRTDSGGAAPSPGMTLKARQNADRKVRNNTPLPSWDRSGRPLLSVIEFEYDEASDDTQDGVRRVETRTGAAGRSSLPLSELHPVAIRVTDEEDAVRILDYVAAQPGHRSEALPSGYSSTRVATTT